MSDFRPFDNTKTVSDESGKRVRFLTDPLAETYIEPLGAWISDGMLPPQEMEVREALVAFKIASDKIASMGLLSRMIGSRYREAKNQHQQASQSLLTLVNSSQEHKAAIRRIVSAMPRDNGGCEFLSAYL